MTLHALYGSKTKKQVPNAKRMQNALAFDDEP